MESISVLMLCPMDDYLEEELSRRYNLLRFWKFPDKKQLLAENADSIRAVVGTSSAGADADLIDAVPRLEIVACFSVGVDKVDLSKCEERGIRVTDTPDVLTDDVADLAIGLMIAVLGRIPLFDRHVRSGSWRGRDFKLTAKQRRGQGGRVGGRPPKPPVNFPLSGKRVGILGLGRIGTAIAHRAEAFNCPISYHSRSKKIDSKYKYYPDVIELASNCDILVVACSLTPETYHIINREVLTALGPKGFLINIARGTHVDEPEMVSALVEGRIGGAGLDVFECEPNVPEALFGLENVVLTPHVGTCSEDTRRTMAELVLGNLEAHFLGKCLSTPVV